MIILAIETSCDETAAAVVTDGLRVLSEAVSSSVRLHEEFGGIVPEIAARAQLEYILPVIDTSLKDAGIQLADVNAIAVTCGPGLVGSLLVGVETAKALAYIRKKPVIPVNHVIAHMYANYVDTGSKKHVVSRGRWQDSFVMRKKHEIRNTKPETRSAPSNDGFSRQAISKSTPNSSFQLPASAVTYPAVSLVVSGGHTELYLMRSATDLAWLGGTLDDAAGEAFDKTARLLGFGHGGGAAIESAASKIKNSKSIIQTSFPRPLLHDESLNFSFSGLKTAVLREVDKYKRLGPLTERLKKEFSRQIQEAITDVLVAKTLRAAEQYGARSVLLSGGVAANSRLRQKFTLADASSRLTIHVPPVGLCTDNAVMIGVYAHIRGVPVRWQDLTVEPSLSVEKHV